MQIKKQWIWAAGILIILLLAYAYLGYVMDAFVVVAALVLCYGLLNYTANRYGV